MTARALLSEAAALVDKDKCGATPCLLATSPVRTVARHSHCLHNSVLQIQGGAGQGQRRSGESSPQIAVV